MEKVKERDSPQADVTAIVAGAFAMSENVRAYVGATCLVLGPVGEVVATGTLAGPFAKMGKCKVSFAAADAAALVPGAPVVVQADTS